MIGWLNKIINVNWRGACAVIFVPNNQLSQADPVQAFLAMIRAERRQRRNIVEVSGKDKTLSELLLNAGFRGRPRRLLLYAHPASALNGFIANSGNREMRILLLRWWEQENKQKFDFIVAHVCHGAQILGRERWAEVFPRWVSYSERIMAFVGTSGAVRRWVSVIEETTAAVEGAKTADGVAKRLRAIYHHAMGTLYDTFVAADGDALNLMYFQKCLDCMVNSEDKND